MTTARPFYKIEEETGNIVKVSHPLFPTSARHFPSFPSLRSKFLAPTKPHQPHKQLAPPALLHNALPADATHALLIPLIVQAPQQQQQQQVAASVGAVEKAPFASSTTTTSSSIIMGRERNVEKPQHERSKCECEEEFVPSKISDEEKFGKNCCERKRDLCDKLTRSMNAKNSMEHFLRNFMAKHGSPAGSDLVDDHLVKHPADRDSFDNLMDRLAEISAKLDNWKHTMRAKFNFHDEPLVVSKNQPSSPQQSPPQQQQFPMVSFSSYKKNQNANAPNSGAKFEHEISANGTMNNNNNNNNNSTLVDQIIPENNTATTVTTTIGAIITTTTVMEETSTTTKPQIEKIISIQERLKNEFATLLGIVEENDRKNGNNYEKNAVKQRAVPNIQTEEFGAFKNLNDSQIPKLPDERNVFARWLKCKDRSKVLSLCL
ncbi:hypothetical protein niasHT_004421 [Heterodera trifolii]|uniref:Uncharacterized protein n=1 Tax=Heterodera trifolii TaxID=157864 RepID=A0ABD2LLY3_9BILA